MNESMPSDRQIAERDTALVPGRPLRLRLPALALLTFWAITLAASWVDKPYFVGFMFGLLCTGLITLLILGWWWFNRVLRMWEKCAGFALLAAEAWVVGRLSHHSINFFTVWLVGWPMVASLIVVWLLVAKRYQFSSARIGFAVVVTLGWSYLLLVRF